MQYQVYHKAFEQEATHVANVELDDTIPVEQGLEKVFRMTNNVEGSWSKGPTYEYAGQTYKNYDYFKNVEVVKPLAVKNNVEWGHRSTSCGDYVVVNGEKWLCAMVGWEKI